MDTSSTNSPPINCSVISTTTDRASVATSNVSAIISIMEENGDLEFLKDSFEIEGGSFYTPLIKETDTYYTFNNSNSSLLGANSFEMSIEDKSDQFEFIFTHSEKMPLLS